MPGFLSHRQPELVEWMDKADCDLKQLHQTYRHFRTVNRFLSGWKRVYKTRIRPKLERDKTNTFLDIGFGGADIPIALEQWSKKMDLRSIFWPLNWMIGHSTSQKR